uniref:Uncharacterized protein n=1 Tax=Tetranychus urticae TaxID=32264 RepID=T1KUF8_TETUR
MLKYYQLPEERVGTSNWRISKSIR